MSRRIIIRSLPTTELHRFVEVEVYYDAGGRSFLSGEFNKRGYYLAVQPVKREGNCKSMLAFSGAKTLIEEVKRFSARKLQEAALQATQLPNYQNLLNHVLTKNNLKLVDGTPCAMATIGAVGQGSPVILPQAGGRHPLPAAA